MRYFDCFGKGNKNVMYPKKFYGAGRKKLAFLKVEGKQRIVILHCLASFLKLLKRPSTFHLFYYKSHICLINLYLTVIRYVSTGKKSNYSALEKVLGCLRALKVSQTKTWHNNVYGNFFPQFYKTSFQNGQNSVVQSSQGHTFRFTLKNTLHFFWSGQIWYFCTILPNF